MKKNILIAGIVIATLFILGLVGFFIFRGKKSSQEVTLPKQEGKLIETTLEERPYVSLTPRTDGREFTLEIARIKNAETVEYELTYLSKGLSRGAVGSIKLKTGETEVARKVLLGTCSRNVCKYDEEVTEGTLTLRFRAPDGVRKFTSEFHLQQGDDKLTSMDGKFKLEGSLSPGAFYLTMLTIGLLGEVEGRVISGPYGSFTAGSETVKSGQVSLEMTEENPSAVLSTWSGQGLQEVKGAKVEGNIISAATGSLGTFIVTAEVAPETPETAE